MREAGDDAPSSPRFTTGGTDAHAFDLPNPPPRPPDCQQPSALARPLAHPGVSSAWFPRAVTRCGALRAPCHRYDEWNRIRRSISPSTAGSPQRQVQAEQVLRSRGPHPWQASRLGERGRWNQVEGHPSDQPPVDRAGHPQGLWGVEPGDLLPLRLLDGHLDPSALQRPQPAAPGGWLRCWPG
jgi:hypothetical protein